MQTNWLNIVLVTPEIPGNTGSIGRTCLALNIRLILIRPYGFNLDEKSVRRAGLDYWKHLQLVEYNSWEEFIQMESPQQLLAFSARSERSFFETQIGDKSYFIFGPESSGLSQEILDQTPSVHLPIPNPKIRSLNLSNIVTTCCYEAYRQLKPKF